MAYLFVKDYEVELMELNSDLSHMFIESHNGAGGERRVTRLRLHQKGLPLTLVNNYSNDGYLTSDTEARDIKKVESELQLISRKSFAGAYVCVPMHPLTKELTNIEKYSPKLAGYLEKRLVSIGITF
tara:strand:+ start:456 stop:836 length:381 start_codon:yes stop_codon:yes gene_type:complete